MLFAVKHLDVYNRLMDVRLRTLLAQTQAWVTRRVDPSNPEHCLRTETLRPESYPTPWVTGEHLSSWAESVAERRAQLLIGAENVGAHRGGRILCVLQEADTLMGEGVPASRGVIDDYYLPPWDTWVAFLPFDPQGVLLAWIPSELVKDVEQARLVAATEPIAWLDLPLHELGSPQIADWRRVASSLAAIAHDLAE